MDLDEANTFSFIVKIWLEEPTGHASGATWRGHITHVPSGQRHDLKDLCAIPAFIAPYLKELGVEPGMRWRVRRWLKWWKRDLTTHA